MLFVELEPGFKGLNQGSTLNLGLTLKPRFKGLNPGSISPKCTFIRLTVKTQVRHGRNAHLLLREVEPRFKGLNPGLN